MTDKLDNLPEAEAARGALAPEFRPSAGSATERGSSDDSADRAAFGEAAFPVAVSVDAADSSPAAPATTAEQIAGERDPSQAHAAGEAQPLGDAAQLPGDPAAIPAAAATEPAAADPVTPPAEKPPAEKKLRRARSGPIEEAPPEPPAERKWYILKVQSNREDSIREALLRKVAIAGLGEFFGEVIVPIETVSEFKNGKKRIVKRKLYPGYIVVHMVLNDDTWFLVRETSGIGDFTGSGGKPSPMLDHEVSKIVAKQEEKTDEAPKLKISFAPGDRAKIIEGTFENFEGEIDAIDVANGRVTVMINIFGRSTPVELEYWQIDSI